METPALKQLMGSYLHQDYGSVGDVFDNVSAFLEDEPDLAMHLPDEIARTLVEYPSEEELDAFVTTLGCQAPPGEGGYRRLLSDVALRVPRGAG